MSKDLDDLAKRIADCESSIATMDDNIHNKVLSMGKWLRLAQQKQKKEQKETGQTWKEWCEEQKMRRAHFPTPGHCSRYILISRYPGAYKSGMSIKQAYAEAGKWKKNGGKEPAEKTTIRARPLITIGAMAGKLDRKIEALTETDIAETATEQSWTDDEILGAVDALTLLRQSCNLALRKLRELQEQKA